MVLVVVTLLLCSPHFMTMQDTGSTALSDCSFTDTTEIGNDSFAPQLTNQRLPDRRV